MKYFFTYEYLENHLAPDAPHHDYIKSKINVSEYETIKKNLTYRTFGNNYLADFNMHIMSNYLNKQYISDEAIKNIQQLSNELNILSGGSKSKKSSSKGAEETSNNSSEDTNLSSEDEDETNIIKSESNQNSETETNQNLDQELNLDEEPDEDFDFNVEELTKEM